MSSPARPAIDKSPASPASARLDTARSGSAASSPGIARLEFQRRASGGKTVLGTAFAASPLRLLTPREPRRRGVGVPRQPRRRARRRRPHRRRRARWATAPPRSLGTQASTKVYRSPRGGAGSSQRCAPRVGPRTRSSPSSPIPSCASRTPATSRPSASPSRRPRRSGSLDGYTCGRSARGERWAFVALRVADDRHARRRALDRRRHAGSTPRTGRSRDRMGRFDVVLTSLVVGPALRQAREAMLAAPCARPRAADVAHGDSVLVAASPLGDDGAFFAWRPNVSSRASHALRSSFAALAAVLGDDPFARKW